MNKYAPANNVEEEMLHAMERSDILLYEIADINEEDRIIMLKDPSSNSNENIKLVLYRHE